MNDFSEISVCQLESKFLLNQCEQIYLFMHSKGYSMKLLTDEYIMEPAKMYKLVRRDEEVDYVSACKCPTNPAVYLVDSPTTLDGSEMKVIISGTQEQFDNMSFIASATSSNSASVCDHSSRHFNHASSITNDLKNAEKAPILANSDLESFVRHVKDLEGPSLGSDNHIMHVDMSSVGDHGTETEIVRENSMRNSDSRSTRRTHRREGSGIRVEEGTNVINTERYDVTKTESVSPKFPEPDREPRDIRPDPATLRASEIGSRCRSRNGGLPPQRSPLYKVADIHLNISANSVSIGNNHRHYNSVATPYNDQDDDRTVTDYEGEEYERAYDKINLPNDFSRYMSNNSRSSPQKRDTQMGDIQMRRQ